MAAAAKNVDAQVARVDFDVGFLSFGQDGHGGGGGMDAALALGHRHALYAVHTGLEFQVFVGLVTPDSKSNFLEAADLVGRFAN